MGQRKITSRIYFRELNLLYWALISGSLILLVFAYAFIPALDPNTSGDVREIILVVFPILAFTSLIFSLVFFRSKMKQLTGEKNLGTMMQEYRSALLVRWTIIEGACYFSIIGFGFLRVNLLLAIIVFLLAYFILQKPSVFRTVTDLELNEKQRQKLEDPEATLYETD